MTDLECMAMTLKPKPNHQFDIISFFRIVKNKRAHQNTTNLFICQKQIDNPKWLILSTYIMCSNITENQTYVTHEISKLWLFFDPTSYVVDLDFTNLYLQASWGTIFEHRKRS